MIYVKSLLAGIAAMVAAALVVPFVATLVPTIKYGPTGVTWNAFNPLQALVQWPFAWFLATIIFGASFYWEFQDVSRHNR
jgi:hypothetical protein